MACLQLIQKIENNESYSALCSALVFPSRTSDKKPATTETPPTRFVAKGAPLHLRCALVSSRSMSAPPPVAANPFAVGAVEPLSFQGASNSPCSVQRRAHHRARIEHNLQRATSGTIGPNSNSGECLACAQCVAWAPACRAALFVSLSSVHATLTCRRVVQHLHRPRPQPSECPTCPREPSLRSLALPRRCRLRRGPLAQEDCSRWSRTRCTLTWTRRTCCTACAWPAFPLAAPSQQQCKTTQTCAPSSLLNGTA